ncbi:MAG TPA: sulfite exporter TauE/SafE family protein [Acidimicrobiia bacterium]|nr:sulfite exporter TauE/SafE family protein [Acidimicrobiia bacterium]
MTTASGTHSGFDFRLVIIAVSGGALSGFFGVGGGILLVPLILLFLAPARKVAHATSLGAIIALSFAGMVGFAMSERVDWVVGVTLGAGGVIGGALGAQLMDKLSARTLRLIFAVVLVAAGLRMLF